MEDSQRQRLREGVRVAYSAAAETPGEEHPFPVGRWFAESVGYSAEILDSLPEDCVDAFSGVSCVSLFAEIPPESTVLDLGCGAGLDALLASRRTGPKGRVIGVDFSEAMLARARQSAAEAGIRHVEFLEGAAERIPLDDNDVDVALVNGIFNLNPARQAIFSELARVVRPSGAVYAAELILKEPLIKEEQTSEENWFA